MEQLEQALAVAEAQRNHLAGELANIPETIPADLFNAGPPDDTERRIVEIEASLRELLSQYTEKHPDVVTLRRQMASLLAKQEAARKEVAAVNGGVMPEEGAFGEPDPPHVPDNVRPTHTQTQRTDLPPPPAGTQP